MFFVATCTDKPESLRLRLDTRPAHLAHLQGLGAKLKIAGALLTPDGQTPIGSMLIFEGESLDEIVALVAEDPFAKVGLFASIDVKPWRQGAGAPLV